MCDLILNSQELFTIGWDENRAGSTIESALVGKTTLSKNDRKKVKDSSTRKRSAPQNPKTKKQPPNNVAVAAAKKGGTPLAKRKTCPEFVLDVGGDRSKNRSSRAAAAKKWAAPETPPFLKHILASYDLDFQRIVTDDDCSVDEQKSEKIISKTTPTRPRPVDFTILLKKPSSKIDLSSSEKDQSTSTISCSSKSKAPPRTTPTTNDRKPAPKIDQSNKAKEEVDDDDDSVFDHSSFLATIDKMVEEAASKKSKSRLSSARRTNGEAESDNNRGPEAESKKSHVPDQCSAAEKVDLDQNFDDDDDGLFERSSFLARLNRIEKTQKFKSQRLAASSATKNCSIFDNFTQISTPLDASTPISSLRRRSARLTGGVLPKQRLILGEDSQEILIVRKNSNPTSVEF